MSRPFRESVRRMLAGNLSIHQDESGLRVEDAVMQIAGAQIKAIAFALAAGESPGRHNPNLWGTDEAFSPEDAITALGGVAALLSNAGTMIAGSDEENADAGR